MNAAILDRKIAEAEESAHVIKWAESMAFQAFFGEKAMPSLEAAVVSMLHDFLEKSPEATFEEAVEASVGQLIPELSPDERAHLEQFAADFFEKRRAENAASDAHFVAPSAAVGGGFLVK